MKLKKSMEEKLRQASQRKPESINAGLRRVMITVLVVLMLAFVASIIIIMGKEQKDNEAKAATNLLNGVKSNVESTMETYYEISSLIMFSKDTKSFLTAKLVDEGLINDTKFGILNTLIVCDNIDSVHIFRNDLQYMKTSKVDYNIDWKRMKDAAWQNIILSKKGTAVVKINGNNALFSKDGKPLITICRAIYDSTTQQQTGIFLMSISKNMLENVYHRQETEDICIMTDEGLFLAGNADMAEYYEEGFLSEEIYSKTFFKDMRHGTISGYKIPDLPIVVMCKTVPEFQSLSLQSTVCIVLLMLAVAFAVWYVGSYATTSITVPLISLSEDIERTKNAGALEKVEIKLPNNEIGMLAESYNDMVVHLQNNINNLLEKEKIIQKAEINVLHEQIKPHFLYNSLETISAMAIDADADEVHSALETLGSFFRNFLSKGDMEVPLRREVRIIKDYLKLQKLRYGEIFEDCYDISEEAEECIVPKLILQPLVENSIYHGVRLKGEPGEIKIRAYVDERYLHIHIRDTGIGMSKEDIERIIHQKEATRDENSLKEKSFGLWGTIERVRYFSDREDVVRITSEIGEFTEIEFYIPKEKTKKQQ